MCNAIGNGIMFGDNGEIRNEFGIPDITSLSSISSMMADMYGIWKDFPDETDYSVVKKLHSSLEKYDAMKREVKSKNIENQIEDCRKEMEVQRKRIEKLEKEMTRIYEEAADAANYLEEHGINPECEKEEEHNGSVWDQISVDWEAFRNAGWTAISPSEWTNGNGFIVGTNAAGNGITLNLDSSDLTSEIVSCSASASKAS
jgi:hypothetical protein